MAVEAAVAKDPLAGDSVFKGFTFHLLRHTACSRLALAGMDPAAAAETAGHTDGGALFLRKYRHLYDGEKRTQAPCGWRRWFGAQLDSSWSDNKSEADSPQQTDEDDGRHLGSNQGTSRV